MTQMNINKNQLQKALEIVKPGLGKSNDSHQADFYGFKDGKVVTYNDEISLAHPVEGLDLEGALYAKELYGLLSKVKGDEISIEHKSREIVLKSGNAKAGFAVRQFEMPLGEIKTSNDWHDLPDGFVEGINFALPCTSKDLSKPIFNSVHINGTDGFIEATDNYRIASYDIKPKMIAGEHLIPARSARQVARINPSYYAVGGSWLHFKNDEGTVLSCRVLSNKFFNTDDYLDIEGYEIAFPEGIEDVLSRAEVFLQDQFFDDQSVEVTVEEDNIIIYAKSDQSWFEESVQADYQGNEMTFKATPRLLKDIFKETKSATITNEVDRIAFEGDGWIYVAMLRK